VNVLREAGQVIPASLTKFGTHVKKKVHTCTHETFFIARA